MSTQDEAVNSLLKLRAELMDQVATIDNTLSAIRGLPKPESEPNGLFIPEQYKPTKPIKKYPDHKLKRLISGEYNHNWKNPEKIMFFLAKYGKMFISDMTDKMLELKPDLTEEDIVKIKLRLGYQAGKMAETGTILREKGDSGTRVAYWLRDDQKI